MRERVREGEGEGEKERTLQLYRYFLLYTPGQPNEHRLIQMLLLVALLDNITS